MPTIDFPNLELDPSEDTEEKQEQEKSDISHDGPFVKIKPEQLFGYDVKYTYYPSKNIIKDKNGWKKFHPQDFGLKHFPAKIEYPPANPKHKYTPPLDSTAAPQSPKTFEYNDSTDTSENFVLYGDAYFSKHYIIDHVVEELTTHLNQGDDLFSWEVHWDPVPNLITIRTTLNINEKTLAVQTLYTPEAIIEEVFTISEIKLMLLEEIMNAIKKRIL